ncbi:MAG: succinate dehydrogenase, hydrophobic membrane anchor protein [Thiohalomonadaceae bacterium]
MTHQVTGLRAWMLQRLSALYLAGYTLGAAVYFLLYPVADHAAWQALWRGPVMSTGAALLFIALLVHAWVGVRDVLLDYVRQPLLRLALLALLWGWLLVLAIWLVRILVGVM